MTLSRLAANLSIAALSAPSLAPAATVFIPEGSANSILMVGTETRETLGRRPGLKAIRRLAGRPGAKYLVAGGCAEIDLATGQQREASLSPAPYHLTTIPESGKLMVSSRAEPKDWIVDQASLTASGEIAIQGEGHQMVVLP